MVMEIFAELESPERAVVLVTHDHGVAATANRVISMRDGGIVSDARQEPAVFAGST
jgi:ABC-type lipoprotein export system ATPase subunit